MILAHWRGLNPSGELAISVVLLYNTFTHESLMETDMNFTRLTTLAFAALLILGGCGNSEDADTFAESSATNPLLSYVPADTPYVFANLEPVPDDVIDTFLARMQPALDSMQSHLGTARAELDSAQAGLDDPATRFAHALLQEFDGKLSRSGLESMGFDLSSQRVLYGMGAFPALRLGLSDPVALRESILRVLNNAGVPAPEQVHQGVSYWRLSDDDSGEATAGLYVAILDDHLAMSLFPIMAEDELLSPFLGLDMPGSSDVQARLRKLNKEHRYTDYGSGILDVRKLADQFMSPDTAAGRVMARSGEFDPAMLSPACVTEFHEIIDNTPLMTMGIQELSVSAIAVQYRLETPPTLGNQLVGLVSKIPAADQLSDRILEAAFGMRFGPVRDFLLEKVTAISEDPFQCEYLGELNHDATRALEQLSQPMPPFLNNFLGIRVSLSEIAMNQGSIPENARGFMAVHVEQPQMFVGMAQMFLPDLSQLSIKPGEPAIRLPENLVPVPGIVAFAAMSEDAIGLALGEGEQDSLQDFLNQDAGPEGTFLSANYDMGAYLDYTGKLGAQYQSQVHTENNDSMHYEAFDDIRNSATRAFRDMADRSYTTMRFTTGGLVVENRMTFK